MTLPSILRPAFTCSSQLRYAYRRCASSSPPTTDQFPKNDVKSSEAGSTSLPRSSCAPDTVLTGVNYLKSQPPVVAQPDDAYPEWLWTVLTPKDYADDGPGGRKERAERRKANQQAIKDRNFMQTQ